MIPIQAIYRARPDSKPQKVTIVSMLFDSHGDLAIIYIREDGTLSWEDDLITFTGCRLALPNQHI